MRGKVQRSLPELLQQRKAKNRKVEEVLQFAGGLSCVDSISKIYVSKWTKKSIRRFLTCSREAAENLICIRSLTDPVSRFVQIYCSDHFPSPLSKSPSRVVSFFPNSKFVVFQGGDLNSMKFSWILRYVARKSRLLFLQPFLPSKIKSRIFLTRRIFLFTAKNFHFLHMLIFI